jgi:DNA-binding MarR family transcriptional regulator
MPTTPAANTDLPPSAKYVAYVLEDTGPMPIRALAEHTGLTRRTVQRASRQLAEEGFVERQRDSGAPGRYILAPTSSTSEAAANEQPPQ